MSEEMLDYRRRVWKMNDEDFAEHMLRELEPLTGALAEAYNKHEPERFKFADTRIRCVLDSAVNRLKNDWWRYQLWK